MAEKLNLYLGNNFSIFKDFYAFIVIKRPVVKTARIGKYSVGWVSLLIHVHRHQQKLNVALLRNRHKVITGGRGSSGFSCTAIFIIMLAVLRINEFVVTSTLFGSFIGRSYLVNRVDRYLSTVSFSKAAFAILAISRAVV